jgi:hypothetical protein
VLLAAAREKAGSIKNSTISSWVFWRLFQPQCPVPTAHPTHDRAPPSVKGLRPHPRRRSDYGHTDGSTGETGLAVNSSLWLTASILQMVHPNGFAWWGNNDHPTTIALATNIQAFAGQNYALFDVTADGSCGPRALAEGLRRAGGGMFPLC